ncbi:MAG TPA: hypothetical protein VK249_29315 [Anaerolineales bacterium]|nr:hypothetical protein [Anaerolineales bacterium]
MKTLRCFTILLLAVLVVSSWVPVPAYAKSSIDTPNTSVLPKPSLGRLRVTNRTGGVVYIRFSGRRSYTFLTAGQGKTTFESVIHPGRYKVTVTALACRGHVEYKRYVIGGVVSLPPIVCRGKRLNNNPD